MGVNQAVGPDLTVLRGDEKPLPAAIDAATLPNSNPYGVWSIPEAAEDLASW